MCHLIQQTLLCVLIESVDVMLLEAWNSLGGHVYVGHLEDYFDITDWLSF